MSSAAESKESEENVVGIIGGAFECKPGQKYPTPSPGNGDRVFYETLLEQNPNSEMAQEWCLAYGVLSEDKAHKLNIIVSKRKGKAFTAVVSPAKVAVKVESKANGKTAAKAAPAAASNKRRKVVDDDDIVGDTGLGGSSSWEKVGKSAM